MRRLGMEDGRMGEEATRPGCYIGGQFGGARKGPAWAVARRGVGARWTRYAILGDVYMGSGRIYYGRRGTCRRYLQGELPVVICLAESFLGWLLAGKLGWAR